MGTVRLYDIAMRIVRAIEDEGPAPDYHREVMARHRAEWPTLWAALDDLVDDIGPSRTPERRRSHD